MSKDEDPIIAEIHACAGPPACVGDKTDAERKACPLCEHIEVHESGAETRRTVDRQ